MIFFKKKGKKKNLFIQLYLPRTILHFEIRIVLSILI